MRFSELKVGTMFKFRELAPAYVKLGESMYKSDEERISTTFYIYDDPNVIICDYFKDLSVGDVFTHKGVQYCKDSKFTAFTRQVPRYDHVRFSPNAIVVPHILANSRFVEALHGTSSQFMYPEDSVSYCVDDVFAVADLLKSQRFIPRKVIFNDPATIVIWSDGTKTVVKRYKKPNGSYGEKYDKEKGLALCYMKKLLGNDNQFHKVFKEWIGG